MNISIFGIIWIGLLVFSLSQKMKYTLYLLLFSFVFQSAWVLEIAGVDLNAALITSVVFILRSFLFLKGKIHVPVWGRYALIFVVFLLVISVISPILFAGMELQAMTNEGYNFGRIDTQIVSFSFSNLTLGLAVFLYVLDAILISNINFHISWISVEKAYRNIFVFVAIVGIIHVVFTFVGLPTPVIRTLFHNEYMLLGSTYLDLLLLPQYNFARLMSTFYEPSYCGAYLATSLMFFYFSDLKHKYRYLALNIITLLLCLSSTGFATAMIVASVVILLPFRKRKFPAKIMGALLIVATIIGIIVILNSTARELLYSFTFGKINSSSYDLRKIVNNYSLEAFFKTYGLGIGGNAVESYSLLYSLLAQTGLVGSICYLLFIISIFKRAKGIAEFNVRWQIVCVVLCPLIASLLACQALNFSVLWMGICIYSLYFSIEDNRNDNLSSKTSSRNRTK